MIGVLALGIAIGAYAAWGLTSLYFWSKTDRGNGRGGGGWSDGVDPISPILWDELDSYPKV